MKRTFDILVCLALALPALVVTVLAMPFIWLETRATPLFRQVRVGRGGRPFTILKLRTMRADTPDGASHDIGASTITRSGAVLRRTKIDELPQLWNVLTGEMSLVGPRPCLPSQIELIAERTRLGVIALRPGITGPAQIAGIDMSDPPRLAQADAAYLRRWSLAGDLRLLVQTAVGRGGGDAAIVRQ